VAPTWQPQATNNAPILLATWQFNATATAPPQATATTFINVPLTATAQAQATATSISPTSVPVPSAVTTSPPHPDRQVCGPDSWEVLRSHEIARRIGDSGITRSHHAIPDAWFDSDRPNRRGFIQRLFDETGGIINLIPSGDGDNRRGYQRNLTPTIFMPQSPNHQRTQNFLTTLRTRFGETWREQLTWNDMLQFLADKEDVLNGGISPECLERYRNTKRDYLRHILCEVAETVTQEALVTILNQALTASPTAAIRNLRQMIEWIEPDEFIRDSVRRLYTDCPRVKTWIGRF
jgi:hypothetical protein